MKRILLSTLLLIGLSPIPTMEAAGFRKTVSKFLTNLQENSGDIANSAVGGINSAVGGIKELIKDPIVYIGGAGLIASAAAGVATMLGYGLYLQKDIASAIITNQITRGSLGKSALGLSLMGAGICSILATKNLHDKTMNS